MFSTSSERLAIVQQASRAMSWLGSRRAAITGGRPPNLQMSILFWVEKLRQQRAGMISRCTSGSSVRARYSTGSSPPSSVTCFRTLLFWAIFTMAYAAYCRTSWSGTLLNEMSRGSMPSSTKPGWLARSDARLAIASTAYRWISNSTSSARASWHRGSSAPTCMRVLRCRSWVQRLPIPSAPTRVQATSWLCRYEMRSWWPPPSMIESEVGPSSAQRLASSRPDSRCTSTNRDRITLIAGRTPPSAATSF
mmetsp:Transcript_41655/g.94004  ORF Transcript_41655/g.94004 Transcript_41655/m.94004 type:complete len:250 (-) Transcript_41655:616-1365(-)